MSKSFKDRFLAAVFVAYLAVVASLTILPTHISQPRTPQSDHINLVPIRNSFRCVQWIYRPHTNLRTFCLVNLLGNVALFLPFGILLPLVTSRFRSFRRVLLIALSLSVSIETIQFFLRFIGSLRAVDIDDVLLNTLGACVGFVLYLYVTRGRRTEVRGQKADVGSQRSEIE